MIRTKLLFSVENGILRPMEFRQDLRLMGRLQEIISFTNRRLNSCIWNMCTVTEVVCNQYAFNNAKMRQSNTQIIIVCIRAELTTVCLSEQAAAASAASSTYSCRSSCLSSPYRPPIFCPGSFTVNQNDFRIQMLLSKRY